MDVFVCNEYQLFIESIEKQDVDQFNMIDIQMNVNRFIFIWKIMVNLNINNYFLISIYIFIFQNSFLISIFILCVVCLKKGLIF